MAQRAPQILHVIETLSGGGAARSSLYAAAEAHKNGWSNHTFLLLQPPTDGGLELAQELEIPIIVQPSRLYTEKLIAQADIVRIDWWNNPSILHFLHQEWPECRMLIRYHVGGVYDPQALVDEYLNLGDEHVLSYGAPLENRELPEYLKEHSQVILHGTRFDRLKQLPPTPHKEFNIGYIGTVDFVKMHPEFVRFSSSINIPEAKFMIVGNHPARPAIEHQAGQRNDLYRYNFLGYQEDISAILARMDVFGYPLREDTYASTELVLQEVMLAGIPPVVLPHGGVSQTIIDGDNGFIVNNASEYKEAIEYLYHNPAERKKMGERAAEHIRNNFGVEKNAAQFAEVYQRMMNQPKRSHKWGKTSWKPVLEQPVRLSDVTGQPETWTPEQQFINSFLEHRNLFQRFWDAHNANRGWPEMYELHRQLGEVSYLALRNGVIPYLQKYPKKPWFCLLYGVCQIHRENWDEATKWIWHGVQQGASHPIYLWYIYRMAQIQGMPDRAGKLAQILEQADPRWRSLGNKAPLPFNKTDRKFSGSVEPQQKSHNEDKKSSLAKDSGSPLISAIISTYNAEHLIEGCLEDLARQTLAEKMEIIVIDSGSQENEKALVEKFAAQQDIPIKYERTEHETVYAAWNRAIEMAKGTYLTNANTDDRHRKDGLEKLVRLLQENPEASVAYGDTLVTHQPNETFEQNSAYTKLEWPDFDPELLKVWAYIGPQPVWRKSLHDKYGYFDASYDVVGDYEFWMRLNEHGEHFIHLPEVIGLQKKKKKNLEHSSPERHVEEKKRVNQKYTHLVTEKTLRWTDQHQLWEYITQLSEQKNFDKLRNASLAAVNLHPAVPEFWVVRAQVLKIQKRYPDALEAIEQAVRLKELPLALKEMADILLLMGEKKQAERVKQYLSKKGETQEPLQKEPDVIETSIQAHRQDVTSKKSVIKDSEQDILVSVILPTKDRPKLLQRALDSLGRQTFSKFEAVVINDGGEDVSELITSYKEQFPIQYLVNEVSEERSSARNEGIRQARGKYIAFLDDDDWYYPVHLQTAVEELEKKDSPDVVYSDVLRVAESYQGQQPVKVYEDIPYSVDYRMGLFYHTNITPITGVVLKKSCLDDAGGFDESLALLEDWELWIRLGEKYTFRHITRVTAAFSWRQDGSTTTSRRAADFTDARKQISEKHDLTGKSEITVPLPEQLSRPLVSMVMVLHNGLNVTHHAIRSILRCTQKHSYELILVDNGSEDGTSHYIQELEQLFPHIRIISMQGNKGFAPANNAGFKAARGELILAINNDVVVTPGWLNPMVDLLLQSAEFGITGPVTNQITGHQQLEEVGYDTYALEGLDAFARRQSAKFEGSYVSVKRVVGFAMMFKRELLEKIGGFDTRYLLGNFEDDDFCIRAGLAGYKVAIAQAAFIHHFSSRAFIAEYFDYDAILSYNQQQFFEKWGVTPDREGSYISASLLELPFDPQKHAAPLSPEPADPKTLKSWLDQNRAAKKGKKLNQFYPNYFLQLYHLVKEFNLKDAPDDYYFLKNAERYRPLDDEVVRLLHQKGLERSPLPANWREQMEQEEVIYKKVDEPKVSAIVSTYKAEEDMEECLVDLLQQTIGDQVEIIVIDSASPENERAIVERFQKSFRNIRYLRTQKRETVYQAWNRGIEMARAKYLTNANTDDRHRADAFEVMMEQMEKEPDIDLVYGGFLVTYKKHDTIPETDGFYYSVFQPHDIEVLFERCYLGPQPMWRARLHETFGYFRTDFTVSGDYEFWLRIAVQGKKFKLIPNLLGLYYMGKDTVEGSNTSVKEKENEIIDQLYSGYFNKDASKVEHKTMPDISGIQEKRDDEGAMNEEDELLKRAADKIRRLIQQQDYENAGLEISRLPSDKVIHHPDLMYLIAHVLYTKGEAQKAFELLKETVTHHPNHGDSLNNLALLYWKNGNAQMGKHLLERAFAESPHDFQVVTNLIDILKDLGEYAEAERKFLQSSIIWEESPFGAEYAFIYQKEKGNAVKAAYYADLGREKFPEKADWNRLLKQIGANSN